MTTCPVPGCSTTPPDGDVFCTDHYFMIPPVYTRTINRIRFACLRAYDDDARTHLRQQLAGYISSAIRAIPGGKNAA